MKLGVIAGMKSTDALLCQALEQAGHTLAIIHPRIPVSEWIPWLTRRIRERGFSTLIGNLLLAGVLRFERSKESLFKHSPWELVGKRPPRWQAVQARAYACADEEEMIQLLKGTEMVVMLDAFRLSHRLFRSLSRPCIQVIWGSVPDFMGDSGGYWAYLERKPVVVTLVERGTQFDRLSVVAKFTVETGAHETLRTIKVKQAAALERHLSSFLSVPRAASTEAKTEQVTCRHFYAPTAWTYLLRRAPSSHPLPLYAGRTSVCAVNLPK